MAATPLPQEYAILLKFEKRIRDVELLLDRLIQNEAALYQGLVACETRLTELETRLVDLEGEMDEMPDAPAGQAH